MTSFKDFVGTPFARYVLPIIPVGASPLVGSLTPDRLGKIPGRVYYDKATGARAWGGYTKKRPWTDEWKLRRLSVIPGILATFDRWYEDDDKKPIIGIRARELPAIDCDIPDKFLSDLVCRLAVQHLGASCIRRRPNSHKFLIMYRHLLKDPAIPKLRKTFESQFGLRFAVEVLGESQQYLIHGAHPSGVDYEWEMGFDPLTVGFENIQVVTLDQLLAFMQAVEEEMAKVGCVVVKGGGGARLSGFESRPREPVGPGFSDLCPDLAMLKDVLTNYLPVTHQEFAIYDDWVTMAIAIVSACGGDEEFYPFFLEWNRADPRFKEDSWVRGKWESVRESSVGWEYICGIAHEYGYAGDVSEMMDELEVTDELPSTPAPSGGDATQESAQIDEFVKRYAKKTLIFAATGHAGEWYRCESGLWRPDQTALTEARSVCCAVADALRKRQAPSAGQLRKADRLSSVSTWEAVLRGARHDPRVVVPHTLLDDAPIVMGTPAGYSNREGELCEPDPSLLLASSTAVIPDFEADCPLFKAFILRLCSGNEELARFFWRAMGYSILGICKEQLLMFLVDDGLGRAGKTTFTTILQKVLGDYAMPLSNDVFVASGSDAHRFTWATLKGKRFVYADEINRGERWATAKLKQLSGGGNVQVERKFLGAEPMLMQSTLWFMANNLPDFPAGDGALLRRLAIIRVMSPFTDDEDQRGFADEAVRLEGPAILAALIREAQAYLKRGQLDIPQSVREQTAEAFKERDEFLEFIEDCCELSPDEKVANQPLYTSYRAWAQRQDVHRPLGRNTFLRMIVEHYELRKSGIRRVKNIETSDKTSPRGFLGIGLKSAIADFTTLRPVA